MQPPLGIDGIGPTKPKGGRLASLDLFRGLTIAGMLLVNNPGPGGTYAPLGHASESGMWFGWTPTDLVFPFFVFIMGVAIPFSFAKRKATDSKGELFLHIVARGIALFLLGDMLYALPRTPPALPGGFEWLGWVRVYVYAFLIVGFLLLLYPWKSKRISIGVPFVVLAGFVGSWWAIHFMDLRAVGQGFDAKDFGGGLLNPDHLRIPGVLQRIGAVYLVAASLGLVLRWRGLVVAWVALIAVYLVLMVGVSYPSIEHPGTMVRNLWGEGDNFARYVDVSVFGHHVYNSYPDPEGLISTLPAIGTAILGILCGLWLRTERELSERCAGMMAFGVMGVIGGYALSASGIPINKPLWTPSYVVLCAGLAMLGLGAFFYVADVKMIRKPFFLLKWYGMNAITAFVMAGIVARVNGMIRWQGEDGKMMSLGAYWSEHVSAWGRQVTFVGIPSHNGSLAFALSFVAVVGVVMGVMYGMKIFLKV